MKTTTSRNRSIAATAILAIFMLSATAHAVYAQIATTTTTATATTCIEQQTETSTETTTTTTSTATSTGTTTDEGQVGVNGASAEDESGTSGTVIEDQCGVNEQGGDNNQVGDNVNVVEEDQSAQTQIQSAEADQTIAGEVQVNDNGVSATVTDSSFSLVPSEGPNGRLDVQVSGQNITGPRSFLISLSNSMNPTTHTLEVTLDGVRVSQASSIGQVLHPSTNAASYIVVKSTSGYQLLVSVPHFSTHMLSIVPLAPGPSQGFFPISGIALAGVAIALTALIAVAFAKRKRVYAPLA